MRFHYFWNAEQPADELEITANPMNKPELVKLERSFNQACTLNVLNPKNNRTVIIEHQKIEIIEALGHLSKVILEDGSEFLLKKTLKELVHMEKFEFFRINNSAILNLQQVNSFQSGDYARLEVFTKSQRKYIVSRHYAKLIRERL